MKASQQLAVKPVRCGVRFLSQANPRAGCSRKSGVGFLCLRLFGVRHCKVINCCKLKCKLKGTRSADNVFSLRISALSGIVYSSTMLRMIFNTLLLLQMTFTSVSQNIIAGVFFIEVVSRNSIIKLNSIISDLCECGKYDDRHCWLLHCTTRRRPACVQTILSLLLILFIISSFKLL